MPLRWSALKFADAATCSSLGPGLAPGLETPEPQIDWRDHFPTAAIVGIALEMRLDLRNQTVRRLIAAGGREPWGERLVRQERRAERKIESRGTERQHDERHDRHGPAPPCRQGGGRAHRRRRLRVGGGDQPARHLDLSGRRLLVLDQPSCPVAVDLVELIAIDRDIAPRAQCVRTARERPEHGEDGRGRHQCQCEP
jgi:hypothetical protein